MHETVLPEDMDRLEAGAENASQALEDARVAQGTAENAQIAAEAAHARADAAHTLAGEARTAAEGAQLAAENAQASADTAGSNALAARQYAFLKITMARPTATLGANAATWFGDSTLSGYYYTSHTPTLPSDSGVDNTWMPVVSPWGSAANIKVFSSGKAAQAAWSDGKLYLAFQAQPTGSIIVDYVLHKKAN